jgi:hypothetical protein
MPQIVAAALAQTAVAAPVAAATVAPAAAAGIGTAAAQTAALELAKQQAIQAGMQQVGVQAGKTAALEASKKGIIDASMQQLAQQAGTQVAQQSAVEAGKQGIAQGFQKMIPQAADDIAAASQGGTGYSGYSQVFGPQPPAPYGGATPPVSTAPASPAPVATTPPPAGNVPSLGSQSSALPPEIMNMPSAPTPTPVEAAARESMRRSAERGFQEYTAREAAANMSPLEKGIRTGLNYFKNMDPLQAGLGLISVGQYMNQPEEEDKDKYKNKVDMSEFKPSLPSVGEFKPSYEYQKYAVGGPVETMAAQNAVGANTGYPQAGINTPMYSNPMIQRPEAVNVLSPSSDAGVGAYSGEPKFAEGGISEEMAREYGLKTRKQRAAKSLTKDYEEMEAERNREATAFANSVNINSEVNPKIIRRSRTQELSSPYSAAIEEHNRLAKKTKTPQFQQPKTSLGDIDTYMDVPVELAARGGIMGNLGSYSDGGRLLRGPGDGVSDSIPAVIGKRQPARLADGEFVIPARIVSELGNGSTEAGARKLYAMMERIQSTRKKSIGKKKVAVNSRADKHLPA